jgi:hypothetical protein
MVCGKKKLKKMQIIISNDKGYYCQLLEINEIKLVNSGEYVKFCVNQRFN